MRCSWRFSAKVSGSAPRRPMVKERSSFGVPSVRIQPFSPWIMRKEGLLLSFAAADEAQKPS